MSAADRDPDRLADFGYERVPWGEKKARVRGVFDSVASRYDLMNDAMSGGLHRLWKRFTVAKTGLRPGQQALDVAAGSGDLAAGLARRVGSSGRVVVTDINAAMLDEGRTRLLNAGIAGNVDYVLADAEALPFAAQSFHCVTIGFGLRNVTDKQRALASLFDVLKPGGRLLVLEFSQRALGPARAAVRALLVSSSAAPRRMARRRRRELPLPRRVDPPSPGSRNAEGHDASAPASSAASTST